MTAPEVEEARRLDRKYQEGFEDLAEGETCPPCPRCGARMIPWDAWLVTGAKCSSEGCGWNMSEGTGCLS